MPASFTRSNIACDLVTAADRVMMLSSGLRTHVYWLSAFLFDFTFQIVLMFMFLCAGLIMQIRCVQRGTTLLAVVLHAPQLLTERVSAL